MKIRRRLLAAVAVLAAPALAFAQTEPSPTDQAATAMPVAEAAPAPASATVTIPAGSIITVELTEGLSSRTTVTGQTFGLRLAEPIVLNDQTLAPAGAIGGGEVVDAHRNGMGGRQGTLTVSGRYIEIGGQRVRIHNMQILVAGQDRSREVVTTAIVIPYVGWLAAFSQGGEIEIPAGTRAQARLATDVVLPLPAIGSAPAPAANTQPATTQSSTLEGQAQ